MQGRKADTSPARNTQQKERRNEHKRKKNLGCLLPRAKSSRTSLVGRNTAKEREETSQSRQGRRPLQRYSTRGSEQGVAAPCEQSPRDPLPPLPPVAVRGQRARTVLQGREARQKGPGARDRDPPAGTGKAVPVCPQIRREAPRRTVDSSRRRKMPVSRAGFQPLLAHLIYNSNVVHPAYRHSWLERVELLKQSRAAREPDVLRTHGLLFGGPEAAPSRGTRQTVGRTVGRLGIRASHVKPATAAARPV